ncbi:MAG TPA: flagellar hook-associated protein FlgK [Dongiaceae bacterium]|jgi:flagellar hook-associated protein 1 FlgK|nr:flagellar hook-associated protein FlgK [Dongiaceae bacterium]
MSLTAALNAALSSLRVTQAALQVTSANIANAQNPDYARKSVSAVSLTLGQDQVGGVAIGGYGRAGNTSLFEHLQELLGQQGSSQTEAEYVGRLQDLLGTNGDNAGLAQTYGAFQAAVQAWQADPANAIAQHGVITSGHDLAEEIHRLAKGVDRLAADAASATKSAVQDVNDTLAQFFDINQQIRQAAPQSAAQADLADQRDKLVRHLSELIDVKPLTHSDGSLSLITPAGLTLFDGTALPLAYDGTNIIRADDGSDVSPLIRNGTLRGLLDVQAPSTDPLHGQLAKLRDQLDGLVSYLSQRSGVTQAYDQAPLTSRVNGSLTTTIEAGVGTSQQTSLSLSGTAQPGDVFTLSVNGRSYRFTASAQNNALDAIAQGLSALVNADPASGVTAIPGPAGLRLAGAQPGQAFTAAVRINDKVPELAQGFFIGSDRFTFDLSLNLLAGTVALKSAAAQPVAHALTQAHTGFSAGGVTLSAANGTDIVTAILTIQASQAKQVKDKADSIQQAQTLSEQRYQSAVGVDLDSEVANLQVLQNAYAASARILTVVQDLYDALQDAVAR